MLWWSGGTSAPIACTTQTTSSECRIGIATTVLAAGFTAGQLEKLSKVPAIKYRVVATNRITSSTDYTGTWVPSCFKSNNQWKLSHNIKVSVISMYSASLYGQADGLLTAWRDNPSFAKYSATLLYAPDKVTVRQVINQGSPTTNLYYLPPTSLSMDFSDVPFFMKAAYDSPALNQLHVLYRGQPQWKVKIKILGRYFVNFNLVTVLGLEPLEKLVPSPVVTAEEIKAAFVRCNEEGLPLFFSATQGGTKVEATLVSRR